MIQKPFDKITAQDINDLVSNKIPEDKTLEYKEALPGPTDSERKECTADITSFANTQGGDLLYGITEERDPTTGRPTGIPKEARGLPTTNPDQEILRLTNLIRDTTNPKLTNLQAKPIQGFPDGPVIILRIPDSWNKPHMVTTNGRFYARTNSGKYQMDTNELRDAFLQSEQLPNRIRAFRDERIKTITNQPPVNLPARPKLILHLIPFQAMRPGFEVDIKALDERTEEIHPYRTIREWQSRYNLDGFLTRVNPENDGSHLWYVLVFRNGIIELVHTAYLQEQQGYKVIHPTNIEREVIDDTTRVWRFQQSLGLEPPLILMLTLANVLGYTLAEGPRPGVDRDTVLLPEALIQEPAPSTPSILRPMFDALWQACGRRESQSYKPDGNWKP